MDAWKEFMNAKCGLVAGTSVDSQSDTLDMAECVISC